MWEEHGTRQCGPTYDVHLFPLWAKFATSKWAGGLPCVTPLIARVVPPVCRHDVIINLIQLESLNFWRHVQLEEEIHAYRKPSFHVLRIRLTSPSIYAETRLITLFFVTVPWRFHTFSVNKSSKPEKTVHLLPSCVIVRFSSFKYYYTTTNKIV